MQSLGCWFSFNSCFSAECSRHQLTWRLHCTRGKKSSMSMLKGGVLQAEWGKSLQVLREQGSFQLIRVTPKSAEMLGTFPFVVYMPKEVAQVPRLSQEKSVQMEKKKSSQWKTFRKLAPKKKKKISPPDSCVEDGNLIKLQSNTKSLLSLVLFFSCIKFLSICQICLCNSLCPLLPFTGGKCYLDGF